MRDALAWPLLVLLAGLWLSSKIDLFQKVTGPRRDLVNEMDRVRREVRDAADGIDRALKERFPSTSRIGVPRVLGGSGHELVLDVALREHREGFDQAPAELKVEWTVGKDHWDDIQDLVNKYRRVLSLTKRLAVATSEPPPEGVLALLKSRSIYTCEQLTQVETSLVAELSQESDDIEAATAPGPTPDAPTPLRRRRRRVVGL